MNQKSRTKEQLSKELNNLHKRIAELEVSEIKLKQSEEILKEKEKKYRAIFENTGAATAIFNDDHIILMVNTEFEKLSGYSKEEIEEKISWKEFVHKDEIERLIEINRLRGIDPNSVPRSYEFKFVDKHENIKDIYITVDRIPNTNLCVASLLNIMDRKKIEEKLAEEHNLLRTLIDNLPEFIYVKDTDSKFVIANKGVANFMGAKSIEDLIDKTDFDFYPKEIAEQYYNDEQEIIRCDKSIIDKTEPSIMPNGEKRWLSTTKVPLKNNHGEIVGIVGLGHDITEHKNLEEQFQQAQKMEAIGKLTGGVAHDFNNILTVIIGFSDYLLMRYKNDKHLISYINNIKEAGNRAASLTHQLLAFSRKQILQPKVVNLNTIILNIKKMVGRLIGEDIELILNLDPSLENAKLDIHQIEQVIMNLAVNARDAMLKGGKLIIETKNVFLGEEYIKNHIPTKPGYYVMLTISDNGIGIDKETQEHIFEPFYTTKKEGKGTGLGLATVYGIIKQSNGYIWVYSELNTGTTFKIYFPSVKKEVEAENKKGTPPKNLSGSETILVVEDDEIVRNMISSVLNTFGYSVLNEKNGEETLELVNKNPNKTIDLMITDVIMPRMSGRDLAENLKFKKPNMKVLYISGYTDNAIVHHGILDSGIPFLQKPFTINDICKKIREVLDS